jgi:dUTP pyrophosphatase
LTRRVPITCSCDSPDLLPRYHSRGSSGADLHADIPEGKTVTIRPGRWELVPTGLRLEIPPGYEAQVRPRSGLSASHGVTVLNTPGTIDSDYRGEIRVILINLGREPFEVARGLRIAQLVFTPVVQADFRLQESLSRSERGEGGFGSTGT